MNETTKVYPKLRLSDLKPEPNVLLVKDSAGLLKIKDLFNRKKLFGLDLETNVVNDLNARFIRTIAVGDAWEQYIIDLLEFAKTYSAQCADLSPVEILKKAQRDPVLREKVFGEIIQILKPALDSKEWLKVGQNLQFDYECLRLCLGLRMWNLYDTMLGEKVIMCGLVAAKTAGYFALDDLVRKYAGFQIDKTLQTSFDDLSRPLDNAQLQYAALDVRLPIGIRGNSNRGQIHLLERDDLVRTAQVEFDAIPAFGDMRVNGFYCDREAWMTTFRKKMVEHAALVKELDAVFIPIVGELAHPQTVNELRNSLPRLEAKWRTTEDKTLRAQYRSEFMTARSSISKYQDRKEKCDGEANINYGSNMELKAALIKLGVPAAKLKDTNDETLAKLAGNPAIDLVRKFRELNKCVTTYGEEFLNKYVSPISGRVHSSIDQIGAKTGRSASSNPNTQNIPTDELYRSCFIAQKGYKIITVDVQGCELRIITDMSGEPVWLEAFSKDWDVHSLGAEYIYPDDWRAATEEGCEFYLDNKKLKCRCKKHGKIRKPIKNVNFGVIYGLSEMGYARDTGKKRTEARKDLEHWRQWVRVLWAFLEKLTQDARMNCESRTTLGRRRLFHRPNPALAISTFKKKFKRAPTDRELSQQLAQLWASVGREGTNAPVQGGNGDLIKLAMGCGFDKNCKPFLWHTLEPELGGLIVNLVHDELVVEGPEANADKIKVMVQDCIERAGSEIYKKVRMVSDGCVADCWQKD